jgi:hypothetical protein
MRPCSEQARAPRTRRGERAEAPGSLQASSAITIAAFALQQPACGFMPAGVVGAEADAAAHACVARGGASV